MSNNLVEILLRPQFDYKLSRLRIQFVNVQKCVVLQVFSFFVHIDYLKQVI